MLTAFFDELVKIADWSLTGPQSIAQHGLSDPHGLAAGPNLSQFISQRQGEQTAQQQAAQLREAKMNRMLQTGEWNPKTHTVNIQGDLVPKKPIVLPKQQKPAVTTTAPTPVGPEGTGIVNQQQALASRPSPIQSPAVSSNPTMIKPKTHVPVESMARPAAQATPAVAHAAPAVAQAAEHAAPAVAQAAEHAAPIAGQVAKKGLRLGRLGRAGKVGLGLAAGAGLLGLGASMAHQSPPAQG